MTSNDSAIPLSLGRSILVVIVGLAISVAGLWFTFFAFRFVTFVAFNLFNDHYPYNYGTVIYYSVWQVAALCLLISGISVVRSGFKRKRHDLVPGPTLYLLGLSVIVIGFFLFTFDNMLLAVLAVVLGALLVYWEWAYAIT